MPLVVGGSLNYFTPNIDFWELFHPQKTWKFTPGHFKPQKLMRKGHTASKSDGDPVYLLWTPILNSSIFYLFGLLTRVCARNLKNNTCVSENSTLLQIRVFLLWSTLASNSTQGSTRKKCWCTYHVLKRGHIVEMLNGSPDNNLHKSPECSAACFTAYFGPLPCKSIQARSYFAAKILNQRVI